MFLISIWTQHTLCNMCCHIELSVMSHLVELLHTICTILIIRKALNAEHNCLIKFLQFNPLIGANLCEPHSNNRTVCHRPLHGYFRLNMKNKPYKFFSVTRGCNNIQEASVIVHVTDEINGVDYWPWTSLLDSVSSSMSRIINGIDYWTSLLGSVSSSMSRMINGVDYR